MEPETLNVIGTISAAVAAGAAFFSMVLARKESRAVRSRDRYVTWCEQPAIRAIEQFHQTLIGPLEKSIRSNPDQDTYQWQAEQVQSAVRALQRELEKGALTLGKPRLEVRLVTACRDMEDGVLGKLHEFAVGEEAPSIDVDKEVRRCTLRIAEIVARGDPTWEN